ncbi:MAG TPA: hypothetical protein VH231_10435 [Solirubrobacteraceae bacterium]|nr:hypothetical protein [Solirubrobacteraceae bacterium]
MLAALERQQGEQRARGPARGQRHRVVVALELEFSEHAHLEHGPSLWFARACDGPRPARRRGYPTTRARVDKAAAVFDTERGVDAGWARYNRNSLRRDYRGFLAFFFAQVFPEPHSTKQHEDCVTWGLARAVADGIASTPRYRSVSGASAGRAAALIAELL